MKILSRFKAIKFNINLALLMICLLLGSCGGLVEAAEGSTSQALSLNLEMTVTCLLTWISNYTFFLGTYSAGYYSPFYSGNSNYFTAVDSYFSGRKHCGIC